MGKDETLAVVLVTDKDDRDMLDSFLCFLRAIQAAKGNSTLVTCCTGSAVSRAVLKETPSLPGAIEKAIDGVRDALKKKETGAEQKTVTDALLSSLCYINKRGGNGRVLVISSASSVLYTERLLRITLQARKNNCPVDTCAVVESETLKHVSTHTGGHYRPCTDLRSTLLTQFLADKETRTGIQYTPPEQPTLLPRIEDTPTDIFWLCTTCCAVCSTPRCPLSQPCGEPR
ncbi:MAG: uncharacterized protein A8A55_0844 [Amphiamblys sp. WSBS2006]|nr:MAG: uncharacterized protein A8A55_0844 [Amphiamblys sp. WSBS2006]